MQCKSPIAIQNDKSGAVQQVPCGRCIFCRVNRTEEWAVRIMHESRMHEYSCFVTLTYDDDHLPGSGSISKDDVQRFLKRLRKRVKVFGRLIRYYLCGEYGEKYGRPHYHVILFGLGRGDSSVIESSWPYGSVHVGYLTAQSARYCAKYMQKKLFGPMALVYEEKGISPEFALMSRKPGIGVDFARKYVDDWFDKGYIVIDGVKRPIPRAYALKVDQDRRYLLQDGRAVDRMERERKEALLAGQQVYELRDEAIRSKRQKEVNLRARMGLKRRGKYE